MPIKTTTQYFESQDHGIVKSTTSTKEDYSDDIAKFRRGFAVAVGLYEPKDIAISIWIEFVAFWSPLTVEETEGSCNVTFCDKEGTIRASAVKYKLTGSILPVTVIRGGQEIYKEFDTLEEVRDYIREILSDKNYFTK